ncbi:MAG: hypothetical protein H5U40_13400, partial [Polyangiaceae bacterium]|nr:hypothetical protein [Polyangiaceae bacterium]
VVADPTALDAELAQGAFLLDVRNESEGRASGRIEPSICIPLNELRARLSELPKERTILIYCATGVRGYYAQRILAQHGLKAKSLSGGYESYRLVRAASTHRR